MHRFTIVTAGFALSLAAAFDSAPESAVAPASRADRCAPSPDGQFRPEAELTDVVERFGYRVVRVGADAGCYAVLGDDGRGKRYDMRFEGTSLRMVSRYFARVEPDVVAQR